MKPKPRHGRPEWRQTRWWLALIALYALAGMMMWLLAGLGAESPLVWMIGGVLMFMVLVLLTRYCLRIAYRDGHRDGRHHR